MLGTKCILYNYILQLSIRTIQALQHTERDRQTEACRQAGRQSDRETEGDTDSESEETNRPGQQVLFGTRPTCVFLCERRQWETTVGATLFGACCQGVIEPVSVREESDSSRQMGMSELRPLKFSLGTGTYRAFC